MPILNIHAVGAQPTPITRVNVFDDKPTTGVPRDKFPQFDGIGIVNRMTDFIPHPDAQPRSIGYANALNIGPCTVLTNYHVNFGDTVVLGEHQDYDLRFSIGYSNINAFGRHVVIKPAVYGDRVYNDFSLNRDDSCSGLRYGYYEISPYTKYQLVKNHSQVMAVWLRPDGKMSVSTGRVSGLDDKTGYVKFSASTTPGSSGGAIFIVDELTGMLLLQGINVGAIGSDLTDYTYPTYRDDKANTFMSVEEIVGRSDARELLARDVKAHPSVNPMVDHIRLRK